MRSTALGLLLLLVTPSLCQSKVPYEQWYVNKTMYPVSRFRDPPEARGRMNPVGYRNYIAGEEEIWNGKQSTKLTSTSEISTIIFSIDLFTFQVNAM